MRHRGPRLFILAAVLLAIWYVLSGRFDLLHFGSGVLVVLAVTANYVSRDDGARFRPLRALYFLPWLTLQVIKSNLRVARTVLSPRMPIAPTFISRSPDVDGARALTTLGVSVTMTPGTLTVDVGADEILIHALDRASAEDIEAGIMARQVAPVFEPVDR